MSDPQTTNLRPGMLIRDNDPRMPDRVLCIVGFDAKDRVIAARKDGSGKSYISRKFVHTDSKPRRSGWSLVQ